jgi:hypothetical protein
MNYSSNQIGLAQSTVYEISAADLAGANSGQRPDLLAKAQAIFRTPDNKTFSANAARNQLVAAAVPVTAETNPFTGGNALLAGGRTYALRKKKIAVAILGQSNERGQVLNADAATNPLAFGSLVNPGFTGSIDGVTSLQSTTTGVYGTPWYALYDAMLAHGYEAQIFNGSIGSMSMVTHAAGQILSARANSTAYHERRTSSDREDFGYAGDFTVQSGKLFVCTTGRKRFASSRAMYRADLPTNSVPKYDYIGAIGSQASAGSDPGTWAATAVGGTVTDGSVVWTNINDTAPVSAGSILSENQSGLGFDPFGILPAGPNVIVV